MKLDTHLQNKYLLKSNLVSLTVRLQGPGKTLDRFCPREADENNEGTVEC